MRWDTTIDWAQLIRTTARNRTLGVLERVGEEHEPRFEPPVLDPHCDEAVRRFLGVEPQHWNPALVLKSPTDLFPSYPY